MSEQTYRVVVCLQCGAQAEPVLDVDAVPPAAKWEPSCPCAADCSCPPVLEALELNVDPEPILREARRLRVAAMVPPGS